MSLKTINLRDDLNGVQIRRAKALAEDVLAQPTRCSDRSLCQDLAHLVHQIEFAAFLAGARSPRGNRNITAHGEPLDRIFLKLYEGAESLMFKAMDEYPVTQGLGKRRPQGER